MWLQTWHSFAKAWRWQCSKIPDKQCPKIVQSGTLIFTIINVYIVFANLFEAIFGLKLFFRERSYLCNTICNLIFIYWNESDKSNNVILALYP